MMWSDKTIPTYAPALEEVPTNRVKSLHDSSGQTVDWGLELLGVDKAWAHTRGKGVKVAVLDTGVHLNHPDLQNNILASRDFTGGGTAQDVRGHGTHCAGIGARLCSHLLQSSCREPALKLSSAHERCSWPSLHVIMSTLSGGPRQHAHAHPCLSFLA